jgi:DNA (cytosine-5)-methyltransferase 1
MRHDPIPDAVDGFAGCGGSSSGMRAAGVDVKLAANHWRWAVDAHALNHPGTQHVCQDLRQADFGAWPKAALGWFSPSCQGHSAAAKPARKASGRVQTTHDALRASAWAVVDYAEVQRPRFLVVENVSKDGGFRAWSLYSVWCQALRNLGYRLTENVLVASRWGVPQRRERLFVVGCLDREIEIRDPDVPEPAFGPCIDWDQGRWRPIDAKLPAGPRRRIARARARGLGDRFLVQNVTGHRGIPLGEPVRTITTADQWAVVDGDRYRTLTLRENLRAQGFPESYVIPGGRRKDFIRGVGNAVPPPVAKGIVSALRAAVA